MPAPTAADRALLRALVAFGADSDPLSALSADWRARLDPTWLGQIRADGPDAARERLHAGLAAEKRPLPDRVHPTWWARAIKGESPAVQRVVLEHFAPASEPGSREFSASVSGPGRREVDPGALRYVLDLWAERLVGGEEPSDDDPAVVRAIAGPGPDLMRQLRAVGLAKLAYAEAGSAPTALVDAPRLRPGAMLLHGDILERLSAGRLHRSLARIASRDAEEARRGPSRPRSLLARLGGMGLARLLTAVEPSRARWALQHLPYDLAKEIRARMSPTLRAELLDWEADLWRVAADCLAARRDFEIGDES